MIDAPYLHDARCREDGVAHDVDDPALIDDIAYALTRAGWRKHNALGRKTGMNVNEIIDNAAADARALEG